MKNKIKMLKLLLLETIIIIVFNTTVFASGITSFAGFTGTQRLLQDATTAALVLLPIITALLIVYFNIRKSGAEQQEQTMWSKRIRTAVFCLIFGELAAAFVNFISSYYG